MELLVKQYLGLSVQREDPQLKPLAQYFVKLVQ